MSNSFFIYQSAKSETVDPNFKNRIYKLNLVCLFMVIEVMNPD